ITGGGLANLRRLNADVGWAITDPLPVPPICALVQARGGVDDAEMWDVFNMGCGFVCVVPDARADEAAALLAARHPGARRIGAVTPEAGRISAPGYADQPSRT